MRNDGRVLRIMMIVLAALSLILSSCNLRAAPSQAAFPLKTSTVSAVNTSTPAPTASPTASKSSAQGIGSTWVRPADGMTMVYVPEGDFVMGDIRTAVNKVYLDAFWIDRTEVTTAMYARCVQAGACQKPSLTKSWTHATYYDDPKYANYPVIWVRWGDAKAYCGWAGARLPTEAEWEKAARGPNGAPSPWGYGQPGKDLLNYNSEVGDTTAVGSYPSGASPYGALDMEGNVWEFVSDWWSEGAYAQPAASNPRGPSSGQYKVLRGGSYTSTESNLHARNSAELMVGAWDYGFRCASSTNAPVAGVTPTASGKPTLADFFKRCPTAAEVADVNARLKLTFENDPTAGALACTAASGSTDLTRLQMRAYQTIIIMKYLQFSRPLPWTDKQLYDWFTGTVKGVDYPYTSGDPSCCTNGIIHYPVHPDGTTFLMTVDVWATGLRGVQPTDEPGTGGSWGPGLMETTAGLIHEARHNQGSGYPHNCGNGGMDTSLSYMGSYGIQYYFFYWLADYSDRDFLRAPGEDPNVYLETAMYMAYWELRHKICNDPTPTPGPIPTIIAPIPNP